MLDLLKFIERLVVLDLHGEALVTAGFGAPPNKDGSKRIQDNRKRVWPKLPLRILQAGCH